MSLKAIASVLGLSVTTVSRALNGYDDVAEVTRKRIEEEASRRGYRPNAAARRLKTGRANTVGLVFPDSSLPLSDSHFIELLQTLDQRLARDEIDLLMLADKPQDQQRTLRMLRSGAIDALIVTHAMPQDIRLQRLQQKGFRFLSLGRSQLAQPYAWFDYDNYAGVKLATDHCLAAGLTRLAWLGGNEPSSFVRDRRRGFLDTVTQHQPLPVPLMATVPPSRRAGYQQTATWLAEGQQPQAIITDCSPLGEGAAIALQQAGRLSGPQAIRLFVYDGLPHDSIIDHPVNAILQCSQQHVGEKLAEMVLQLLEGTPVNQLQTLWQPRLHLTSD
ncbi:putative ThuR, regulatory protein for trehalosemaltose transport [Pantoea sp. AS-PWVM4]|uniref:LacI family DNA-binding transcriptional regulator n=1 Tax=Pantoea sp. AS-PWVM4 TaxID=1332069 RepID=UPI0003AC94A1|nr:LacI family DNA-binding transcriptional regulator [Pantoea sp. AS-PWVM4]ERK17063.1 putative ThuR, regulatory protein for trehalosemaltose transport [Pantoea sp. AS-PWVM4]